MAPNQETSMRKSFSPLSNNEITNNGTSTTNDKQNDSIVIATFHATKIPNSKQCPFGNKAVSFDLKAGGCIHLTGNSGIGKTTLSSYLAGLQGKSRLLKLGIDASIKWNDDIPTIERCGVLFQQTTLLDALTLAGNVAVALRSCPSHASLFQKEEACRMKIAELLQSVGLNYERDASKRPSELSGGMARRASLALQLAQRKRVIVLDEPFTGLDRESAISVAKELVRLRLLHGTSLILISHEPDLAKLVMDPVQTKDNVTVELIPPIHDENRNSTHSILSNKPSLFGTTSWHRFVEDLADFILWSLPLISLAFLACGAAIAMLSSDILKRIDVTDQVLSIVSQEIKPMMKLLTGEEPGAITMMMINMKVRSMLDNVMPSAKANLYALGMAKLFVLEIGPLLTALLLCGRIGGSYAGRVATMRATAQDQLLQTLGMNSRMWTLAPALMAAIFASPLLTVTGTFFAILLGGFVGPKYGIGSWDTYVEHVQKATFPTLRLQSFTPQSLERYCFNNSISDNNNTCQGTSFTQSIFHFARNLDLRCTYSDSYIDSIVEIATYPPIFLLIKSLIYIFLILVVGECAARFRTHLTPRNVPNVITSSVVISSLIIILADWAFSQLWLLRK